MAGSQLHITITDEFKLKLDARICTRAVRTQVVDNVKAALHIRHREIVLIDIGAISILNLVHLSSATLLNLNLAIRTKLITFFNPLPPMIDCALFAYSSANSVH